jgi:hypothetical protein
MVKFLGNGRLSAKTGRFWGFEPVLLLFYLSDLRTLEKPVTHPFR